MCNHNRTGLYTFQSKRDSIKAKRKARFPLFKSHCSEWEHIQYKCSEVPQPQNSQLLLSLGGPKQAFSARPSIRRDFINLWATPPVVVIAIAAIFPKWTDICQFNHLESVSFYVGRTKRRFEDRTKQNNLTKLLYNTPFTTNKRAPPP